RVCRRKHGLSRQNHRRSVGQSRSMTGRPKRPSVDISPYVVAMPETPVCWTEVFGNDHPVELEVGSGKGLFLANSANANPNRNYFGIEIAKKYAKEGAERLAKAGLQNAKMLPDDARLFLHEFVPVASLDAVHIYFPDPWWKNR